MIYMKLYKEQVYILSDFSFELAKGFALSAIVQQTFGSSNIFTRVINLVVFVLSTCICLFFSIQFKSKDLYYE